MTEPDSQRFNHLRDQIKTFPQTPGVYFMKDSQDRVLYIGKAKSLRERVSSYFQPSADLAQTRGPKIAEMIT
ncbi:MAG: GIY-YIG nuclease family protein, partial [Planctomycetes bacterium]|nr:GIY-YIG nuclease family protein [Planctomycetota bacterium]